MADKINIIYFLEDRAQEGFIKALVERVAAEEGVPSESLKHDVRSARLGSKSIVEFRRFLRDARKAVGSRSDLVIVSIDGNCKGYNERVRQLNKYIKSEDWYSSRILYAIPDPHIERWYLMDQKALRDGIGLDRSPAVPTYKCKKGYYKQILNKALRDAGLQSLLGGPEYAEKIIAGISNLRAFAQNNAGLERFIEQLKTVLRAR